MLPPCCGPQSTVEPGIELAGLAELGLQIDSDVPYCVYGRTAHVRGRGDHHAAVEATGCVGCLGQAR